MATCPEYRLRLFLSVDLVGSTAYKAGRGSDSGQRSTHPRWVDEKRHFYREFPTWLRAEYKRICTAAQSSGERSPEVWKTVGDEIIFCVRLNDHYHLGRCIEAFLKTLATYSSYLEANSVPLDVKGVGWTAAFPAPNITVPVVDKHSPRTENEHGLLDDEAIEAYGDIYPSKFEFLGKEIDAGFRVAKHAGADRFALSLEAAYLLAQGCTEGACTFPFMYGGREELKGVIGGRPYPIVAIDTERRASRRKVSAYERTLSGNRDVSPHVLLEFLSAFIEDEKVEFPILALDTTSTHNNFITVTYERFKNIWKEQYKEPEQRSKVENLSFSENASQEQRDNPVAEAEVLSENDETLRSYLREVAAKFEEK